MSDLDEQSFESDLSVVTRKPVLTPGSESPAKALTSDHMTNPTCSRSTNFYLMYFLSIEEESHQFKKLVWPKKFLDTGRTATQLHSR